MKQLWIVAFVFLVGLAVTGCKISEEKACKKVLTARNESAKHKKTAKELEEKIKKCQERMKERKGKKPKRIECEMKCIDKNDKWDGMKKCMKDEKCREKDK